MREEGFVKAVCEQTCEVIIRRKTACGENCASCKAGCEAKEQICVAENTIGAKVGDRVIVEMDSKKVLKSAFLVYILPILVFLTVLVTSLENNVGEGKSAVIALVGACAVFFCVAIYSKSHKKDYLSRVVEII